MSNALSILVEERYGWRQLARTSEQEIWFQGSRRATEAFVKFCHARPDVGMEDQAAFLYQSLGHFALIARMGEDLLAVVDKTRSCPVFYYHNGHTFLVSNSGRRLREALNLEAVDESSLLEYEMSGYVSGPHTLFQDLYQLQAGEFLKWHASEDRLATRRYYIYFSETSRDENEETLVDALDEVTDTTFQRIVDEIDGAPIWVPLSAGLDSRLVLCKLKQLGCDRIQAFSYGPPKNHEAKWARIIAEKVGVPWRFIPYRPSDIRSFFHSTNRKAYWRMGGEYASLPFMVDEYAIWTLRKENEIDSNSFIINGQSGDFITGGHSYGYHLHLEPDDQGEYDFDKVIDGVIKKHYSLNYELLTKKKIDVIGEKIKSLLEPYDSGIFDVEGVTKRYDWWEWQERQSKYVVNGQRSYDYFGVRWALPLWRDEYLLFWQSVPYAWKYRQRLYKAFLRRQDYYGLFRQFQPAVWNWQGRSMAAIPVGSLLRRLFGEKVSKQFYHYFGYFGKYQNHFAPFGFKQWVRRASKIKSPFVFYIETLLDENNIKRSYT